MPLVGQDYLLDPIPSYAQKKIRGKFVKLWINFSTNIAELYFEL